MESLKFFIHLSFRPHYVSRGLPASKRNEYQRSSLGGKGGRCVRLNTLASSCADFLEILRASTPGTLEAYLGLSRDSFTFRYMTESEVKRSIYLFIYQCKAQVHMHTTNAYGGLQMVWYGSKKASFTFKLCLDVLYTRKCCFVYAHERVFTKVVPALKHCAQNCHA